MRLSVRTRILSAFVVSFALFLGAIGYSLSQLRALGDGLRLVNEGYLPLARTTAQVESYQERIDLDASRLQREATRPLAAFRANSSFHATAIRTLVERGQATARRTLALTAQTDERLALETALAQLERLGELAGEYETATQEWVQRAEAGDRAGERAAQAEMLRRQKELQALVKQLGANVEGRIRTVNEHVARTQSRAAYLGGGLSAGALLSGVAMLGWALLTLRPIGRLTTEVQRVATGDYSGRVEVRSQDEIGLLAKEFNAMAQALDERDRRLVERAEELRRLSQYLRSVLDTIRLGLVVVEDEVSTMVNPAAQALWGVEEGRRLPPDLAPLDPGRHAALPFRDRRVDLEVAPFGPAGRLLVGEDVTDRLAAQERLARSERLALIGQMLAQVTHEVRNPLNAISLNAELLGEEITTLDPESHTEAAEILGVVVQEIRRLEEVTEHYLDLARRPGPALHAEDVNDLVRSVCRLEEAAFEQAGIALDLRLPQEPADARVDGNRLRRALLNVLRNALQSGARRVEVSVGAADGAVEILVTDDGPGMDPATLSQAFDPFFSTRSQGTGLGLAITRQIVEDHGGRVQVATAPGSGFRIGLRFPRRPGA